MTDRLTRENILKYMKRGEFFALDVLGEVTSTNALAKEAAKNGAGQFSVVAADSQSGGRGRLGRSFFSPPDTGLYLSVVLRPDESVNPTLITSGAAVLMSEAIEEAFGVFSEIKWVNDLYLSGKKICGILTEASFSGKENPDFIVLGAGVNVFPPDGGFPESIDGTAGSLLRDYIPDARCRLAAAFLDRLFEKRDAVFCGEHMEEYRRRCRITGNTVDIISQNAVYPAEIVSINDDCSLTVNTGNGDLQKIFSGEVSIRKKTVEKSDTL